MVGFTATQKHTENGCTFGSGCYLVKSRISRLLDGTGLGSTPLVWNLVPACLMLTIWRERNRCVFEDLESPESQILVTFSTSLYQWPRVSGFTSSSSFVSFTETLGLTHISPSL